MALHLPGIGLFAVASVAVMSLAAGEAVADARFDRVKAAFTDWADHNHIKSASLVLIDSGAVVGKYDRGSYTTATPAPVASDSKFITGLCVLKAATNGKLDLDAKLGDLLLDFVVKHPPRDARAANITVRQLLTQSSGMTNDPSQGSALNAFKPFTKPSAASQLAAAWSKPLGTAPGQAYFYNNMNYAALGLVIEAATGEGYEPYCAREVLAPVGITDARLNPNWMSMGAYGGWLISAEDYARLMAYVARNSSRLLAMDASQWPRFELGGGASYGPGVVMRPSGNGWVNAWHFGSWNTGSKAANNFGAYFAFWDGSMGVFADYTPTISDDQQAALDAAMGKAVFN